MLAVTDDLQAELWCGLEGSWRALWAAFCMPVH